jgi:hypothetical protein
LVDRPANQHAAVTLYKRASDTPAHAPAPDVPDPIAKKESILKFLDSLALQKARDRNVTFAHAYRDLLNSPSGRELYAQTL